jgi:hypothetical protein
VASVIDVFGRLKPGKQLLAEFEAKSRDSGEKGGGQ